MAVTQRITDAEYEDLALRDSDAVWELWDGVPREKPGMSATHNSVPPLLGHVLLNQIDWDVYAVRVDAPRLRVATGTYFVPDVAVVPLALEAEVDPAGLEVYAAPLPFVAEVWSPSTGAYDVNVKLPRYQERGDAEIWRLHPFERTLTAWRRQPDGSYAATTYRGGVVPIASLPGVAIDLDALFDRRRPGA